MISSSSTLVQYPAVLSASDQARLQLCPPSRVSGTLSSHLPFCVDNICAFRYLSHLTQAKPAETPNTALSARDKDYSSRLSGALSSSIVSIGDLFKDIRDGSKSVKFPEKMVKVLEQKLQDIAMARDAA